MNIVYIKVHLIIHMMKFKNGKKFDIVLMNPPYSDSIAGGMYLDMQFVQKVNQICDKQIVIHPAGKWISNTKLGKENAENGHLKELEVHDAYDVFNISTQWRYVGIYTYDNKNTYKTVKFIDLHGEESDVDYDNFEERKKTYMGLSYPKDIIKIIDKKDYLHSKLTNEHHTMVNDTDVWIYEENRLQRGHKAFNVTKKDQSSLERVKKYLKSGKYKYCLYKGSFNHTYDEVQEWKGQDPDTLFKGQVCWLTNKENVKNNIRYWLECPICDLWRKYYFGVDGGTSTHCHYGYIPALNFDKPEDDFKEYVDSLNDFTNDEIKILKDFDVHNADKL